SASSRASSALICWRSASISGSAHAGAVANASNAVAAASNERMAISLIARGGRGSYCPLALCITQVLCNSSILNKGPQTGLKIPLYNACATLDYGHETLP